MTARIGGVSFPAHTRTAEQARGIAPEQRLHQRARVGNAADAVEEAIYTQCRAAREARQAAREEQRLHRATLQGYHDEHGSRILHSLGVCS